MEKFYSESHNTFVSTIHSVFYSAYKRFPAFAIKSKNAGEIADYSIWISSRFPEAKYFSTREKLWTKMSEDLSESKTTVIELGVAWGYTTNWWLKNFKKPNMEWHGFDLFTGLPTEWRGLGKGHFDAKGLTPEIEDPRVNWHVGFVEETIKNLDIRELSLSQCFIFFDLDLYAPSEEAWNYLQNSLKSGDVLYFDEAFDEGERKLLEKKILPFFEVQAIGNTPLALAIKILNRK